MQPTKLLFLSLWFLWLQHQLCTHIQQQFLYALPGADSLRYVFVHAVVETWTATCYQWSPCVRSTHTPLPEPGLNIPWSPKGWETFFIFLMGGLPGCWTATGKAKGVQVEFPYGYVRLDLFPVSGLTDIFIHCVFWVSHAAVLNESAGTNRSIYQDVLLLLFPAVIISTLNKLVWTQTFIWKQVFCIFTEFLSVMWAICRCLLEGILFCCLEMKAAACCEDVIMQHTEAIDYYVVFLKRKLMVLNNAVTWSHSPGKF